MWSLPASAKTAIVLHKWFENEQTYMKQQQSNSRANFTRNLPCEYIVDAVLDAVSRNTNCAQLEFINGSFVPTQLEKEIVLDHDISCMIKEVTRTHGGHDIVDHMTIEVSSQTKNSSDLTAWLSNLHDKYKERLENELGAGLLFFNQTNTGSKYGYQDPRGPPTSLDEKRLKQMALANADKQLTFTKSTFFSNKSFSNLYGINMRRIEARVDHFLNNKKWYDDRGIPYQLTIMLSGQPGRGKSSVVRAIANRAQRHIVNVAFHSIQTATQLKNLTYSPYIDVFADDEQRQIRKYRVPLDKRITVYDEVDATGTLLFDRGGKDVKASDAEFDELTLGDVLQAFEGSVEVPGSIRIVNTNYPELLDKAFTRPGRIDLNITFQDDNDAEIATIMFERFFDRKLSEDWACKLEGLKMSPVEINEVFFRFFGETNDDIIISELLKSNERIKRQPTRLATDAEIPKPEVGTAVKLNYTTNGSRMNYLLC